MPVRPPRALRLVAVAVLAAACTSSASGSVADPPPRSPDPAADPAGADPTSDRPPAPDQAAAGAHEISLVADLGPLPGGAGRAVVESTWTVDAAGTVRVAIDTPAGLADQHVYTADQHWWWFNEEVRREIADTEWVRFDLAAIADAGGELPDVVLDARQPPPQPDEVAVGQLVAGREVLAVEVVGHDEVHLTVAGIERPVVHRRRSLPVGTVVEVPSGAVDVGDLPEVLRW